MSSTALTREYRFTGLDRILYDSEPQWREGTFHQVDLEEGHLVLRRDGISSPAQLAEAIAWSDLVAERFRLAISFRTKSRVNSKLVRSDSPRFEAAGTARLQDGMGLSDRADVAYQPRSPPSEIECLHESSARWVASLAEVRALSEYQDEALKRLYLLIEELVPHYAHLLDVGDRQKLVKIKYLRDFVSHARCGHVELCNYISAHLPSAVVCVAPLKVGFDRTDIEHKNFVGRHQPDAERIVDVLLRAAIHGL